MSSSAGFVSLLVPAPLCRSTIPRDRSRPDGLILYSLVDRCSSVLAWAPPDDDYGCAMRNAPCASVRVRLPLDSFGLGVGRLRSMYAYVRLENQVTAWEAVIHQREVAQRAWSIVRTPKLKPIRAKPAKSAFALSVYIQTWTVHHARSHLSYFGHFHGLR